MGTLQLPHASFYSQGKELTPLKDYSSTQIQQIPQKEELKVLLIQVQEEINKIFQAIHLFLDSIPDNPPPSQNS